MFIQSRDPVRPKDESKEKREPKARSAPGGPSLSQTLARMRRTPQGDDLTVMNYTNYLPTPVYSSDKLPLMPCHPARARILLRNGRAVPHHTKGIFGIRMLDRTREESEVQEIDLRIDQGSRTTDIAVTTDNPEGERTVLAAVEIRHRAPAIKNKMTKRSQKRRRRRYKLGYRQPRKNHKPKPGTLTPSVDSLRVDTMRAVNTIQQMYPISAISIERNKFDPQLMMDPNINGIEYQRGTLYGWQLRAYIFDRDHGRCICCRKTTGRLEVDHIRPRAIGSNRVDNLAVLCRECNLAKSNKPIEEFLADQPELLATILKRLERSNLTGAAHINAALPAIIRDLECLGLPLTLTDAASVSWARKELGIPKTHCYDATLQGDSFTTITTLPAKVLEITPMNGRSKQKANVDDEGTPKGAKFRKDQAKPKHLRKRNPAHAHSDRHQRHGPQHLATGDTAVVKGITGRIKIQDRGATAVLTGTKPAITCPIRHCRLIARNPRHSLKWTKPSQQKHRGENNEAETANSAGSPNGKPTPPLSDS